MVPMRAGLNTYQCFTLITINVFAGNSHFDINPNQAVHRAAFKLKEWQAQDLSPELDHGLRDLRGGIDRFGVRLEVALCSDQTDQFFGNIHV